MTGVTMEGPAPLRPLKEKSLENSKDKAGKTTRKEGGLGHRGLHEVRTQPRSPRDEPGPLASPPATSTARPLPMQRQRAN